MKKSDVLYWFKLTFDGRLKWYKIKYIQKISNDVSRIKILKKFYDNIKDVIGDQDNIYDVDNSEIFSMKDLLWRKNILFKMIFTVG